MSGTTFVIKQFGVISVGKFFAVFGLVWGFFAGILLAAGLGGMGTVLGSHTLGFGAGIFGLIFMVIIGGIIGFIGGAVVAVIYNIVLGAMGGVELDLEVRP
jgi:hypothetical protein